MKNFLNISIIVAICFFSFTSCSEDKKEEVNVLNIVETQLQITSRGGNGKITVDPDAAQLSANSNESWCTVVVSGTQVNVSVAANNELLSRTALVTLEAGNKTAKVPVTQSGSKFSIDRNSFDIDYKANSVEVNVYHDNEVTVVSNNGWLHATMDEDVLAISADANPEMINSRTGTIDLKCGIRTLTVTVNQGGAPIPYEAFLGNYTMSFATSNAAPINRNRTLPVTLLEGEAGKSFYLKGILSDEDEAKCDGIVVIFDEDRMELSILGQILFERAANNNFWLTVYSDATNGNYTSPGNTVAGLVSTDMELVSGKLKFSTTDNAVWGSQKCAGFVLRNLDASNTNLGNVTTGKIGTGAMFFYPMFEQE